MKCDCFLEVNHGQSAAEPLKLPSKRKEKKIRRKQRKAESASAPSQPAASTQPSASSRPSPQDVQRQPQLQPNFREPTRGKVKRMPPMTEQELVSIKKKQEAACPQVHLTWATSAAQRQFFVISFPYFCSDKAAKEKGMTMEQYLDWKTRRP